MLQLKDANGTLVEEKELVMISFEIGKYFILKLTRRYKYKTCDVYYDDAQSLREDYIEIMKLLMKGKSFNTIKLDEAIKGYEKYSKNIITDDILKRLKSCKTLNECEKILNKKFELSYSDDIRDTYGASFANGLLDIYVNKVRGGLEFEFYGN